MKRWGFVPRRIIADKLRSYGEAMRRVSDLLCMIDPVHASPKGSIRGMENRGQRRLM